jgi:four helix bundle suffix protein
MPKLTTFLPPGGGYEGLSVYKKATVIYDMTFHFAHRFLSNGDRTIDQMVQAARSGKQNIAEGSAASSTSTETELKLMNVARASMKELLVDYEDYLRVRRLPQWPLNDQRAVKTRTYCKKHVEAPDFMQGIEQRSDEAIANIVITQLHQFDSMMGKLIERLEKDFVAKGGIRERMTAARLGYRQKQEAELQHLREENQRLKAKLKELGVSWEE